jgi:hypothetical protein
MREPFLPFFINRDAGIPDPGAAGEAGRITCMGSRSGADRTT